VTGMDEPDAMQAGYEARRAHELALLVDSVRDYAILLLDAEGIVTTWNTGAERLKGYTEREIVGQHFSVFYTEEDRAREGPNKALSIALREGRFEQEGWRVRKDGSRFWANVVITGIWERDGTLLGYGKVTRDLTTRRLAEERLRKTSTDLVAINVELEQFRRLVLSVRDYAIFLLDPGGYVTTWNLGAQNAKGYTYEEIVGQHFSVFYTEEDRTRDHPADELRIAAAAGRHEEEGWRVRKDGTRFWANVTLTAVRDDEGALIGYAKVTRDLSERRRADQALREANQRLARSNRELDGFAATAAHDLQEPLRTVAGFSGLLQQRHGAQLEAGARGYLDHITAAVVRMERLVDHLLGYARAGQSSAGGGDPIALAEALATVVEEQATAITAGGVVVEVDVGSDTRVLAERHDVEAALRNLVSNAVKFADPEAPRVTVHAVLVDTRVRVDVVDNGIGIDPADRPRLFQPFQRLNSASEYPGTGLGLAIAQRLIERNDGTIGVESTVGEGSRFWFTLPAA
jgi:PAS domain S-box-containing protein